MKKVSAVLLTVILLVLCAAGCGQQTSSRQELITIDVFDVAAKP